MATRLLKSLFFLCLIVFSTDLFAQIIAITPHAIQVTGHTNGAEPSTDGSFTFTATPAAPIAM